MAKRENSMSGSSGNDAGARLSLLKSTLLSTAGGSTSEQSPGITGASYTPLPTMSSPEDMSNSSVSIFQGQSPADQGASDTTTNESERVLKGGGSNSSSSGYMMVANTNSSTTTSGGNQSLDEGMPKKYFCKVCDQGFTRKHNMASHELIHSSSKPHVCRVCDSRFRRVHDLKRHEKLHTGEKPFHCTKCTRRFARPDALIRHQNSPNACSGNAHSLNRTGGTYFSHIIPSGSASASTMSSPTTTTDSKSRDSDLSKWKILQNDSQNPTTYQAYPPTHPLNNDIKTSTVIQANNKSTSDNELQSQQLNEYYHSESREPYLSLQSQYSPPQPSPPYLQYYPHVSSNHPSHLLSPPILRNNLANQNQPSGPQHGTSPTGYVSISKYQDLVAYTHRLQEDLAKMDSRLKYLESKSAEWSKKDDSDEPKDQKQ